MSQKTLKILIDARALIAEPQKWFGKGGHGRRCVLFAIQDAGADRPMCDPAKIAFCRASGATTGDIGSWNDSHTYEEVIAALDRAIEAGRALAQAQGKQQQDQG